MKVIHISNNILKGIFQKELVLRKSTEADCVLGKSFQPAQIQLAQPSVQPHESKWYYKYHNKEGVHRKQRFPVLLTDVLRQLLVGNSVQFVLQVVRDVL